MTQALLRGRPRPAWGRRALAGLLLAALALSAWGCGSGSSGGNEVSGSQNAGSSLNPASPATVLRLLFTRARIVITNSAQVTGLRISLQSASGATLEVRGPINLAESIDLPIPAVIAPQVARVSIEVLIAGGQVREVITAPVSLAVGQTTTVETGTSTPAVLTALMQQVVTNNTLGPIPANFTVNIGSSAQLAAIGTYTAGNYTTTSPLNSSVLTWTSDNVTAATVNSNGLVTGVNIGLASITAAQGNVTASVLVSVGNFVSSSPTPSPTPSSSPGASPSPSPGASPSASASPGASPDASPGASPSPSVTPGVLILNKTSVLTVPMVGVQITGTVNGTAVTVTLTSGNTSVASVSGDRLVGGIVGTTNFTATSGNLSAQGTVSVVSGTLQGNLLLVPSNALAVAEGTQTQFQATAQYGTPSNGTLTLDVSDKCVWLVTSTDAQTTGNIISFDSGFGKFTATRGQGGTLNVGAIYSEVSAVATSNTVVTVNKSDPTITIRPAGSQEIAAARVPSGGWSRLFEAVATYPSGFSKVLLGADVSWSNGNGAVATLVDQGGRRELISTNTGAIGSTLLTATYNNSQSTVSGTHNVGVISYTLASTQAALTPGLPADLMVIPGRGVTGLNDGFVRPLTVTCTFLDKNPASGNLVMPLFVSPGATSASKAGSISLYLRPTIVGTPAPGGLAGGRLATDRTIKLLTNAITPVGYTHLLRNVTTGFYQNNTLNVRVQYHPTGASLTSIGPLSNSISGTVSDVNGTSSAVGGDRDVARTGNLTLTLDASTSFTLTATNTNLRRGQATNATLRANYGVGGSEDVTALTDWLISTNGANATVGNATDAFGAVRGRVSMIAPPGGGAGNVTVGARYPHVSPGGDTTNTTVNVTLP